MSITEFFLSIWIMLSSMFGSSTSHKPIVIDTPPPTITPLQNSAPSAAITACEKNALGDSCDFILGEKNISGVCSQSGQVLACGPSIPTQQNNN